MKSDWRSGCERDRMQQANQQRQRKQRVGQSGR